MKQEVLNSPRSPSFSMDQRNVVMNWFFVLLNAIWSYFSCNFFTFFMLRVQGLMSVESLGVQLKLVIDLASRIVSSTTTTQYGAESMGELVASQGAHFEVLVAGLKDQLRIREDTFNRALSKTQREQASLTEEISRIETLLSNMSVQNDTSLLASATEHVDSSEKFVEEAVTGSGVEELSLLRDRLRAQIAQLDSFSIGNS